MNFLRRIISLILMSSFIAPNFAFAAMKNEGIRSPIDYDQKTKMCTTGSFAGALDMGSKDYNFELSNANCMAFMVGFGTVLMLNQAATTLLCKPTPGTGPFSDPIFGPASMGPHLPWPTPTSLQKAGQLISVCAARSADLGLAQAACNPPGNPAICATAPLITSDMLKCCPSVVVLGASLTAAIGSLMGIWGIANQAYHSTRLCGHNWEEWYQEKVGSDKWIRSDGVYQKCLRELFVHGGNFDIEAHNRSAEAGDYPKKDLRPTIEDCREALSSVKSYGGDDLSLNGVNWIDKAKQPGIQNRWYRDFIYGGIEYEDDSCPNITAQDDPKIDQAEILTKNFGYKTNYQRYYMRGPNISSNYACERFIMGDAEFRDNASSAYNCCRKRGETTVCIEAKDTADTNYYHRFCDLGGGCNIGNIDYKIYESKESNYLCAKTYSVCPYNHLVGGGTEDYELIAGTTDKKINFCQFRNHCAKKYISPKMQGMNLGGNRYISKACKDLRGDAQNFLSYESDIIPIKGRHFSAPIVQCVKETMNNFLNNLDGMTGKKITDQDSILSKIQTLLKDAIRVALILSVVFLGGSILLAAPAKSIERKTLMIYLMKMALVFYFATGNGWQEGFSSGVLNISTTLSDLTFRPIDDERGNNTNTIPPEKLDGCQFPRYNLGKDASNPSYPENLEYLRIFDILDCKIARALGYGVDVNVPNLVLMLISGFFTGGLAIIFFIATMMFAIFLIALTIKALHIFLMSTISIALLIFVSPITITCAMFEKTKNIFQGWLKQLMAFSLQPMILFAYLGIMITVFDQVIIGKDVTFSGNAQSGKILNCNEKADQNSIYCIFKVKDIRRSPFNLEQLGIALPMLGNMDGAKLSTITKAAIIMFIFSKFMDQITLFASRLVGGANLGADAWKASATNAAAKARGAMRAVQKRVNRASIKVGKGAARGGAKAGRLASDIVGNKGKSVKEGGSGESGGSHAESNRDNEVSSVKSSANSKDDNTKK